MTNNFHIEFKMLLPLLSSKLCISGTMQARDTIFAPYCTLSKATPNPVGYAASL